MMRSVIGHLRRRPRRAVVVGLDRGCVGVLVGAAAVGAGTDLTDGLVGKQHARGDRQAARETVREIAQVVDAKLEVDA